MKNGLEITDEEIRQWLKKAQAEFIALARKNKSKFSDFGLNYAFKELLLKNLTGRHIGRLGKGSIDPTPPHVEIREVLALKSSDLFEIIENGFKRRYKSLTKNRKTRGIGIEEALRFFEIEIPNIPLSSLADFLERAYRLLGPEDDYPSPPPS